MGIESEATKETVARQSIKNVRDLAIRVRENVQRVIVGKSESIDLAVIALLCRGHVLIEDVPGTGKTTLTKALAASLNCEFHRIQFTLTWFRPMSLESTTSTCGPANLSSDRGPYSHRYCWPTR